MPPSCGRALGLDQPLYVQYGIFLKGLARLDFGNSLFIREPALSSGPGAVPGDHRS